MWEFSERDDDPLSVALDPGNVLPRRMQHWSENDPQRPFLIEADHGRAETYGSFHDLTRRWARLLAERGVVAGDCVVSMLPSSVDAHAMWIGASLIGALDVPVNPELRGELLRHVLTDCGARLCVVRPEHVPIIEGSAVDGLDVLVAPRDGTLAEGTAPLDLDMLPSPGDPSCVIYTSGTTGPAKGVVISWAQMSATIGRIPRSWMSDADAVYSCWPMFHVTGRSPMFSMASVGGRVVLRERFSLAEFWTDVRKHGCTSTTVGAVTGLLLAQPPSSDDLDHPMRHVLFGKVGREGWQFLQRFGVHGLCCYGSTEVGFPIVNREIDSCDHATTDGATIPGCEVAGWLRRGYRARVLDDGDRDVDPGCIGELWICPPDRRLIMGEYLHQPELTAAAVVDGWYRTGDAVYQIADGGLVFVDRMRDTIRRFGENISSAALEAVVRGEPDVFECAAVGVPSPVTGQEILLFVVPMPGATTDPQHLAERLRSTLPRHMNPAYIAMVDELPTTPTGKVRKVGLADNIDLATAWSTR